jgi:hypothetical protein
MSTITSILKCARDSSQSNKTRKRNEDLRIIGEDAGDNVVCPQEI